MRTERKFENELGRAIKITALASTAGNSIGFSIQGPFSTASNVLTRREAEELHSALGEVIKDSSSASKEQKS